MKTAPHPVEPEELMAYLDGELEIGRASAVGAHLEQCSECQAIAADLGSTGQRLLGVQVERSSDRLADKVTAAVNARHPPPRPPSLQSADYENGRGLGAGSGPLGDLPQ